MMYTFKKTNKGIYGDSFEMAVKKALKRKNADKVSPAGVSDFRFHNKNYDVKQNGTVLKYNLSGKYIKGSNRVIYASHIAYDIIAEDDEYITISVDLANTQMFVLDRYEFVEFLETIGAVKINKAYGTANIQSCYNYKKDAYHGAIGRKIEAWAYEHELDDDVIGYILEGLE